MGNETMNMSEIKDQPLNELQASLAASRKELFELRLGASTGQVKETSQFKKLRVQIARIMTVMTQKLNKAQ
jgi:large subunit ribosomal protein L29